MELGKICVLRDFSEGFLETSSGATYFYEEVRTFREIALIYCKTGKTRAVDNIDFKKCFQFI